MSSLPFFCVTKSTCLCAAHATSVFGRWFMTRGQGVLDSIIMQLI